MSSEAERRDTWRRLLADENLSLLLDLVTETFNATVSEFADAGCISGEATWDVDNVQDFDDVANVIHSKLRSPSKGEVPFRRLPLEFKRKMRARRDYDELQQRCFELRPLFDMLREHRNRREHARKGPVSPSRVQSLASTILRLLELAPADCRNRRAKEVAALRDQCDEALIAVLSRRSGMTPSGAATSDRAELSFPVETTEETIEISVKSANPRPDAMFQIDSVETSFSTGKQRLIPESVAKLELRSYGSNRFQVWLFDASGKVTRDGPEPFAITRSYAHEPEPSRCAARLELGFGNGAAVGEWIVRGDAELPLQGQCVRRTAIPPSRGDDGPVRLDLRMTRRPPAASKGISLGFLSLKSTGVRHATRDGNLEVRCDFETRPEGWIDVSVSTTGTCPKQLGQRTFPFPQQPAQFYRFCANRLDRAVRATSWNLDYARHLEEEGTTGAEAEVEAAEELRFRVFAAFRDVAERVDDILETDVADGLGTEILDNSLDEMVNDQIAESSNTCTADAIHALLGREKFLHALEDAASSVEQVAEEFSDGGVLTLDEFQILQQSPSDRHRTRAVRTFRWRRNRFPYDRPTEPLAVGDPIRYRGLLDLGRRALREGRTSLLEESLERMRELDFYAAKPDPRGPVPWVEPPLIPAERWLPMGHPLGASEKAGRLVAAGALWQIYAPAESEGRIVVVTRELADWWLDSGLVEGEVLEGLPLAGRTVQRLAGSGSGPLLSYMPDSFESALALARGVSRSRRLTDASFHDAIYSDVNGHVFPTLGGTEGLSDDEVLGRCLSGGVPVLASSVEEIERLAPLNVEEIQEVLRVAEIGSRGIMSVRSASLLRQDERKSDRTFRLPGRRELDEFFNTEILDIIRNEDSYRKAGIGFPGGVLLHGPPGCGKTYAAEKLTEFLGWPVFRINSAVVGSPYIHETGRKVGELFEEAEREAPAVVVIDEMEAFLGARQAGPSGTHHLEELGEFLRRIEVVAAKRVLVIGMTNRLDLIDSAILRTGRFDHCVEVEMPDREDVTALLHDLLQDVAAPDLELDDATEELKGRPLSDAAFLVGNAKRYAIDAESRRRPRGQKPDGEPFKVSSEELSRALKKLRERSPRPAASQPSPIGFRASRDNSGGQGGAASSPDPVAT